VKIVIAVVAAAALAAVVGAVWVGARTFERTVVADPYESGIHHDADRRKAQALGWIVAVDEGSLRAGPEAAVAVRLTGKDGAPLDDADVLFRVSRAGTSRFDRSAKASNAGSGRYAALLPMTEPGFWDLDVVVRRGGESLTLGKWVHVAGEVGEGVHCDAGLRPCAADADGVRVVLELSPHPPVPLKQIDAVVQLSRGGAPVAGAEVAVLLSMTGMFMGENRIPLRAGEDRRYAGKGALLRCASGRRDWLAEVVVRLPGGGEARARFPFQAAE
jgi:nitrogen fixation protein FixH